jgi:DnaJ-class molecular chaperone
VARVIDADPGPEEPRSCLRCDGGGEVYWNPSHIGDPQLEQSAPCPRCDGSATEPGTGAST